MSDTLRQAYDLIKTNHLDEAEAILRDYLTGAPDSAEALHGLGLVELHRERLEQARTFMARAVSLRPDNSIIHHNLAVALSQLGDHNGAAAHFRKTISLKRDYASAYFHLSSLHRLKAGDPLIGSIEGLLAEDSCSQADLCFLHFAAGKAYDDIGDYDRAMAHFHKANAAKEARYDPAATTRFMERSTAFYTPDRMASLAGGGLEDERMVFVVGMPRSGTSLVEQIIASHPRAHGAGELENIPTLNRLAHSDHERLAQSVRLQPRADGPQPLGSRSGLSGRKPINERRPTTVRFDASRVRSLAERYLREVTAREIDMGMDPKVELIVDKQPENLRYLGLIALMFPKARIIHCRRDPRDTCLSCYFQNFRIGNRYAYDLAHLGFYHRYYQALMRHWRDILGIEMLEIDYERLVAEPEPAIREIIAYCGLPWDAACLDFHKTKRPVLTATAPGAGPPAALPRLGRALVPLREAPGSAARSLGRRLGEC
jgi:tetratricopeptide (TPR) repeat protein